MILPEGYSMVEILWDASEGDVGISGLRWVPPKRITFWETLTPKILTKEEPIRGIEPPPFKFVYHRCRARSRYDTRAGIMRVCAWMAFAEVDGMPCGWDAPVPSFRFLRFSEL